MRASMSLAVSICASLRKSMSAHLSPYFFLAVGFEAQIFSSWLLAKRISIQGEGYSSAADFCHLSETSFSFSDFTFAAVGASSYVITDDSPTLRNDTTRLSFML